MTYSDDGCYPMGFGEAALERMYPDPPDPRPCEGCCNRIRVHLGGGFWACLKGDDAYPLEDDAVEEDGCWEE